MAFHDKDMGASQRQSRNRGELFALGQARQSNRPQIHSDKDIEDFHENGFQDRSNDSLQIPLVRAHLPDHQQSSHSHLGLNEGSRKNQPLDFIRVDAFPGPDDFGRKLGNFSEGF